MIETCEKEVVYISDPFSSYVDEDVLEQVSISKELEGEQRGSKMIVTADDHIYRRTRGGLRNNLGCYFGTITKAILKMRPDAQRCKGNV